MTHGNICLMYFVVLVQTGDQLTLGALSKKICLVIFSLWSKLFHLTKFNDSFFLIHGWLSELNWSEHFLLSSSILRIPHDCSLLSLFPTDGQLALSFEVHLTLFLLWASPRQGLLTLIFFCLKQILQRESGLWILQCYDRFRHISSANRTTICCHEYGFSIAS